MRTHRTYPMLYLPLALALLALLLLLILPALTGDEEPARARRGGVAFRR